MKLRILLAASLLITASAGVAQNVRNGFASNKKGQLLGIHFSMSDFITPKTFKSSPTPISRSERAFPNIKDLSAGFAVSYWRGITPKIDFSAKLNGVFHDFSAIYNNVPGRTEMGVEIEPTINIRPMGDDNRWAPFLTAGIGGGLYTNRVGAYAPVGGGLQLNWGSTTYFFAQMQYHFALTKKILGDNLYYSIGFAESFGPEKKIMPPPPPPPPVITDRDGDGVPDVDDKCPDVKGVAALQGCPDRDGDGIGDAEDNCPDVRGLAKYKGCPIPDTDKDGINDEEDKCITVPGVARYQGCPIPDGDGDGVNDEEDKCPTIPGVASNAGCPEIKKEDVAKVDFAAKNIYFATGSSKLLSKSFKGLNEVAKILAENPGMKIEIEGHTDNTGTPEKNQALSTARAESVKAYLASKGVSNESMESEGFGQDKPVADNKTAAGRAKNRRVELKVSY